MEMLQEVYSTMGFKLKRLDEYVIVNELSCPEITIRIVEFATTPKIAMISFTHALMGYMNTTEAASQDPMVILSVFQKEWSDKAMYKYFYPHLNLAD